jgi:hypothetical protein
MEQEIEDESRIIVLHGDKFLPTMLLKNIEWPFKDKPAIVAEYGTVATKGKYKGKPSPYGLMTFTMHVDEIDPVWYPFINKYSTHLFDAGCDEVEDEEGQKMWGHTQPLR